MKLNRLILVLFIAASATYGIAWGLYFVLHAINKALDSIVITPQW